jgi:peptide-O-fucosyltransferase
LAIRTQYGEDFNFRKKCIYRALSLVNALAQATPTKTWTLVLPPFVDLKNGGDTKPVHLFFSMSVLRNAFKNVIEMDDYNNFVVNRRVDSAIFIRRETNKRAGYMGTIDCPSHDTNDIVSEAFGAFKYDEENGHEVSVGKDQYSVQSLECRALGGLFIPGQPLVDMLLKAVDGKMSVLLGGFDKIRMGMDNSEIDSFWKRRSYVWYSMEILEAAGDFISKMPVQMHGEQGTKTFVAAHLRRNDFAKAHTDTYCTVSEIATALADALGTSGLSTLFIASDATETELANIVSQVQNKYQQTVCAVPSVGDACPPLKVFSYNPEAYGFGKKPKKMNAMQLALVEQAIAAQAARFIGTHHSTFSMEIHFERHVKSIDWATADVTMTKRGKLIPLCQGPDSPASESACEPWW